MQEIAQLDKDSAFITVGAKLMLDKNSPYLNSVVINKGSNVRIKLGMPVLSKGNLVGRIVEVNYISSRILLLNDLNSKIPAVISPSGEQAILSGIGKKNPTLEYLPDGFQNVDNLTVYTSGKDGVLFPGISIGKIIRDEDDESAEEEEMTVKLAALTKVVKAAYVAPPDAKPKVSILKSDVIVTDDGLKKIRLTLNNTGSAHKILKQTSIKLIPIDESGKPLADQERAYIPVELQGVLNILANSQRIIDINWPEGFSESIKKVNVSL